MQDATYGGIVVQARAGATATTKQRSKNSSSHVEVRCSSVESAAPAAAAAGTRACLVFCTSFTPSSSRRRQAKQVDHRETPGRCGRRRPPARLGGAQRLDAHFPRDRLARCQPERRAAQVSGGERAVLGDLGLADDLLRKVDECVHQARYQAPARLQRVGAGDLVVGVRVEAAGE